MIGLLSQQATIANKQQLQISNNCNKQQWPQQSTMAATSNNRNKQQWPQQPKINSRNSNATQQ